jgi:transposase
MPRKPLRVIRQRTACINRIHGLLAEFGLAVAQSPEALRLALPNSIEAATKEIPGLLRRHQRS